MTVKESLLNSIKTDLGANFYSQDNTVLTALFDETLNEALAVSNLREETDDNIKKLSPEIKKCVKTLYLQRGAEDVTAQSISGLSSTYDDAFMKLRQDIIGSGKRILI